MKIMVLGPALPWSYETWCATLLREAGGDVLHWDNHRRNLLSPLTRLPGDLRRLGQGIYDSNASMAFYRACKRFKPEVLFVPKADNIHSRAVREAIESTRARLVIWYPDNPFRADQTSMNVIRNLRRCDIFYIWGKFLVDALRSAGCRRVEYLPFGFYPPYYAVHGATSPPDAETWRCDICFVGTWDADRERALLPLAGRSLAIHGPGWRANCSRESPLRPHVRSDGLYGGDMARAYAGAAIVFNHLRDHNGSAHNHRTMEIAGIGGGVQVVRRTPEQAGELFTEGADL